jgi:acyl-CoA reductase-like NAD-dependent aldehyde dehydrogenase
MSDGESDGEMDGEVNGEVWGEGPVIVVHTAAQATAALGAAVRAGRAVVLASSPDASASMGPGMFGAIIAAAREAEPDACALAVLDCGERPGDAMAALREGIEAVCFRGAPEVAAKLADMAEQSGMRVLTELPVSLDMAEIRDPEAAAFGLLSS